MKKLFLCLLLAAAAAAYWTLGMRPDQREWFRAKVRSIPEWSPVSY